MVAAVDVAAAASSDYPLVEEGLEVGTCSDPVAGVESSHWLARYLCWYRGRAREVHGLCRPVASMSWLALCLLWAGTDCRSVEGVHCPIAGIRHRVRAGRGGEACRRDAEA